jgi:hypothetical protein
MACFVNPFESCYAVFLVELRTLSQVSHAVEILDLEKIAAAFGAAGYDF